MWNIGSDKFELQPFSKTGEVLYSTEGDIELAEPKAPPTGEDGEEMQGVMEDGEVNYVDTEYAAVVPTGGPAVYTMGAGNGYSQIPAGKQIV